MPDQIGGLEIDLCGGPGGQMAPLIVTTNIPAAAANGWVHMVIPIDPPTREPGRVQWFCVS